MTLKFNMLGSDPEFFLYHPATEKVVVAIGMIGGSKIEPIPLQGGAALEDNVTAEINPMPGRTKKEFVGNIQTLLNSLYDFFGGKYTFYFKDTHRFPQSYLQQIGPMAMESGCSSYMCNISKKVASPPAMVNLGGYRYAGGHVHISFKNPEEIEIDRLIARLDRYVYEPIERSKASLLQSENLRGRMSQIGTPGLYRKKEYGVEYRSPSNIWLRSKEGMEWMWDAVNAAIESYNTGKGQDVVPFPVTRQSLYSPLKSEVA